MKSFIKLLAVALMISVGNAALTTRHSLAEIFNGAYSYVNTTYVGSILLLFFFKYPNLITFYFLYYCNALINFTSR